MTASQPLPLAELSPAEQAVTLNSGELEATLAALHAYRFETQQYLRGYAQDTTHDDCCPTARAREALRIERRNALQERLQEIDGAIAALVPAASEEPR